MESCKCRVFVVYKESVSREMPTGVFHIAMNVEWVLYVPANSLPTYESRLAKSTLNLVSELRTSG